MSPKPANSAAPEPEDYEVSAFEPPYPDPEILPDRRLKARVFALLIALCTFIGLGVILATVEIVRAIGHWLT